MTSAARYPLLGLLCAAVACADAQTARAPEREARAREPSAARAGASPLDAAALDSAELPGGLAYRGHPLAARRWRDQLGDNLLLLTRTDHFHAHPCPPDEVECGWDRELYGYHYLLGQEPPRLLWRTVDAVRDCQLEMTLEVAPATVRVTDLDADGIAESTYMYGMVCRSDVSPHELKLLMHEGATKYAIRGAAFNPYARSAAEMKVDSAFDNAPVVFRSFAVGLWKEFEDDLIWSRAEWREPPE